MRLCPTVVVQCVLNNILVFVNNMITVALKQAILLFALWFLIKVSTASS